MKPRIVQIIPSLDRSGAEKQLVLLADGLSRQDMDVHVCCLTRGGPYVADLNALGIETTIIGKRFRADPGAYWRLRRYLKSLKPDLVQTWLFAANAYGRMAARQVGVPHVLANERCVDLWKAGYELAIDRWLASRSDRVVVNSTGVRDFYVAKGIPTDKFAIIHNGISPAPAIHSTRSEVLSELGLPPDARLIGSIARLWPQKRLKDAIWAADLLKVIRADVHLLLIGDGPQRAKLEKFTRQCHITDRVHFLGHRSDVPRLLPHFDVLWLTSGYEGLPNAVMEAMSYGVPVVASDIPGNRDLVVSDVTGYLVPVGDRAELARHTHWILEDRALAQRMGEAAKARMLEEFSVERMVSRYAELYRSLLR